MNLPQLRTAVRLTLGMGLSGTQLSNEELDRSVHLAMINLNRFFPRERVATHVWAKDVTGESFTSDHDTVVTLANKPIKFNSETVTSDPAGTTYTRNTDYEMDYINGTITVLSTGSMADATGFLITYERDPRTLDISSILTEPINLSRLDIRDSHELNKKYEGWEIWGDLLYLHWPDSWKSGLTDNDHVNIWYLSQHTEPTESASGSHPRFLDETLVVGATGYSLIIEGLARKHQAVTDLASSRTSMSNITAIHTAIGTVITALAVTKGDINTALDDARTQLSATSTMVTNAATEIALANTEADKIATEVALANTELDKYDVTNGPIDDAESRLSEAVTALADIDTILDKVATHVTEADTAIDAIDTELDKVPTSADNAITELTRATTGAGPYLDTGDNLLNAINDAPNAPIDYLQYAQGRIGIGSMYITEGQTRLAFCNARVSEAGSRFSMAQSFINEATARLSHTQTLVAAASAHLAVADRHIGAAQGYLGVGNGYAQASQAYISTARSYLEQATTQIQYGLAYAQEAATRVNESNIHIAEINTRISQITAYLAEADRYQSSSDRELRTGAEFERQGLEYILSFRRALEDRQVRTRRESRSAPQHPEPGHFRQGRTLTGDEG